MSSLWSGVARRVCKRAGHFETGESPSCPRPPWFARCVRELSTRVIFLSRVGSICHFQASIVCQSAVSVHHAAQRCFARHIPSKGMPNDCRRSIGRSLKSFSWFCFATCLRVGRVGIPSDVQRCCCCCYSLLLRVVLVVCMSLLPCFVPPTFSPHSSNAVGCLSG